LTIPREKNVRREKEEHVRRRRKLRAHKKAIASRLGGRAIVEED